MFMEAESRDELGGGGVGGGLMTAARCPSTPAIVWKSGRKGKRAFNYWSWRVESDEKEGRRRRRRRR